MDTKSFHELPKDQQRVAIARDVLKHLKAGKIQPQSDYFVTEESFQPALAYAPADAELRDYLKPSCTVCAVGALFITSIRVHDKFRVRDANAADEDDRTGVGAVEIRHYLSQFFDEEEQRRIEVAFEQGRGWYSRDGRMDCAMWAGHDDLDKHANPGDRLRLIMENIIVHGGTFNPLLQPVFKSGKWTTPGFVEEVTP